MNNGISTQIIKGLRSVKDWYFDTPERAIEQAHNAALRIKAIEDEYFEGKKISANPSQYGDSEMSYLQLELQQNLTIISNRLREFKASRSFLNLITNQKATKLKTFPANGNNGHQKTSGISDPASVILEKLRFIDRVVSKYKVEQPKASTSLIVVSKDNVNLEANQAGSKNRNTQQDEVYSVSSDQVNKIETVVDKTGILPRSIFSTLNRIQRELDPQSEQEVVRKYRTSKEKTAISLRFILTLIIVPLLSFQLFKIALASPVVDRLIENQKISIFINRDLEEEALADLKKFEERIKFDYLISGATKLTEEEIESKLKERAKDIAEESKKASADAIKNVFSDIAALGVFALVIIFSRRELAILKSFMDEIVYGLSDSAKAFIIILFTDIFVGYHSPHGWEILLENVSRHLGIPESRDFIFLFIATFPVILDTVFKYWIFRYLNRISPSAVATYRNMNE